MDTIQEKKSKISVQYHNSGVFDVYLDALIQDYYYRQWEHFADAESKAVEHFRQEIFNISDDFLKECQEMFNINNQMRIHPRAFAQMDDNEKSELLQVTKDLDCKKVSINVILDSPEYQSTRDILWKYRLFFDCQLPKQLMYIARHSTLDVEGPILSNITPFQISKLYNFLIRVCNTDFKKNLAVRFAEYVGATTFSKFCAAGEFAVSVLGEKEKTRMDVDSESHSSEAEITEQYLEELKQKFDELIQDYIDTDLTFSNAWTAATHYAKHGKDICEIMGVAKPSLKEYVKLARKTKDEITPRCYWSQEGTRLMQYHETTIKGLKCVLVLSQNVFKKNEKIRISTFYKDKEE